MNQQMMRSAVMVILNRIVMHHSSLRLILTNANSESKKGSTVTKPAESAGLNLITIEDRQVGDVSWSVYKSWMIAAGGIIMVILIVSLFVIAESTNVMTSWWLSFWSENRGTGSPWFYLGIYIAMNALICILSLAKELVGRFVPLKASKVLFDQLLSAILHAPMSFFDTTPLGRIINRFSKDIYTIDEQLPQTIRLYAQTVIRVLSVLTYIIIVSPFFIIALLPLIYFYITSQRYYIKTSRELSRLDSILRSPIYALFSETLDGLTTIRAFEKEDHFQKKNNVLIDTNQKAYFLNFSANCWLAVRLEFTGSLIVTMAALLAVIARDYHGASSKGLNSDLEGEKHKMAMFAGMAGLAISLSLSVTQSLNWTVRMASDMESQMVSVERVATYSAMPQEAAHYTSFDPPSSWPTQGEIKMRDVQMRYRPGLPLVLTGINLEIKPCEKIGIVGRTGAGKSSLLTVFLRLVELESGSVFIDGVDISKIGLSCLRSRIAVIPQDPVLFSGTVRSNLDPFHLYSDTTIWEVLRRAELMKSVSSLEDTVSENGTNFSVGQRQLLCIARALLLKSKIIVMDEATAAVDIETDAAIQKSIREEFRTATCLTVAHRLNTIMGSDKIMVMSEGRVAEFDTPSNLLSSNYNKDGSPSLFSSLVTQWENLDD